MKCIKSKTNAYIRVSDEEAAEKVATGDWHYVPKQAYKAAKRDGRLES